MNPGPAEEVGSTLRTIVDALKGQPAVLVLSLVIITLLIFFYYALHSAAVFRETLIKQVLDNSSAIHAMLQQRSVACPDKP
jgi:hypothetical protein